MRSDVAPVRCCGSPGNATRSTASILAAGALATAFRAFYAALKPAY